MEAKLSPAKHKIWSSIKGGLKEVELIQQGKMKAKTAKEFLDEQLRDFSRPAENQTY